MQSDKMVGNNFIVRQFSYKGVYGHLTSITKL